MQHLLSTRSLWIVVTGIVLAGIGAATGLWKARMPITKIQITGCQLLDPAELQALLSDSAIARAHSSGNFATIASSLLRHPFVQHVSLHRSYQTLTIHVVEKRPVAFVVVRNSVPKLLLPDTLVPYRSFRTPLSLPILHVHSASTARLLAQSLSQFPALSQRISEIMLRDDYYGVATTIPTTTVLLFDPQQLPQQWDKAEQLLQTPAGQQLFAYTQLIDFRWKQRVIISKKRARRWHNASNLQARAAMPTAQY